MPCINHDPERLRAELARLLAARPTDVAAFTEARLARIREIRDLLGLATITPPRITAKWDASMREQRRRERAIG